MPLSSLFCLFLVVGLVAPALPADAQESATQRSATQPSDAELRERVMAVLKETPLIDGHIDVPWAYRKRVDLHLDQIDFNDTTNLTPPMHTDLTRLRQGGVGGVFWSVYVPIAESGGGGPADVQALFEQIDFVHRLIEKYPEHLELALTAHDVERIHGEGKIASLIGMEGGHSIGNSLAILRRAYAAGARYMTLAHGKNNAWADSATDDPMHDGLTPFGREVVKEMNRLGMLVDLSHVSPAVMHQTLDMTEVPVMFSHSSARGVADHPRNVPDDVLQRMEENGGVVMVTFVPGYVSERAAAWDDARDEAHDAAREAHPNDEEAVRAAMEEWEAANPPVRPTVKEVADHVDHMVKVAGIDHVGIGSDYDGISSLPVGLEDASTFPNLLVELLKRGYSDEDLAKIAGENILRVVRAAEAAAMRIQKEGGPSDILIHEADTGGELLQPDAGSVTKPTSRS